MHKKKKGKKGKPPERRPSHKRLGSENSVPGTSLFRPSEFMRARRPELFSDSRVVSEPQLSPEVFGYQLETLTSRKQEIEFENFCRRLAEAELCPNLLPQTGPTGGGDSKVDSETYPVADQLSLRWYEGIGREAAHERWAFAFSAMKDWRSKVQSDVKKIVETGRDYKLIYFITNQYVRDKSRAETEDELSKKYQTTVRILDRTWITKCIFEHGKIRTAVEALHIGQLSTASEKLTGPNDVERQTELKELEQQIRDPDRYRGVEYQLVEDCLRAALLARGLELPRVEIDGRFLRAERLAKQPGRPQQQLRVAYNKAWTSFWWFDELVEFIELYKEAEGLAILSNQATDLELLTNLWSLLSASVRAERVGADAASLEARTVTLRKALDQLAGDKERPNNALWARTNSLLMDFQDAVGDSKRLSEVLQEFRRILKGADGLIDYPLEAVAKILRELGNVFTDDPEYDVLLEDVIGITERRVGDSEAGRVLLERGLQKLRKGKAYDAIRFLGRAQQKLALRETRGELVAALLACGLGYQSAGLPWAARANTLAAANQALSEFTEHGEIVPQALACLRSLVWSELTLGRIPYVLQWIEVSTIVAQNMALPDERKRLFLEEREEQDRFLGLLLLKAKFSELSQLEFLPTILSHLGLEYSRMALLYALGYEDRLRSQGVVPAEESHDTVRDFFAEWVKHPAAEHFPDRPELLSENKLALRSRVLGCEVTAFTNSDFASICLAEAILAALEALLATSLEREVFPHAQKFDIHLEISDTVGEVPQFEFGPNRTVRVSYNPKEEKGLKSSVSWLQELVVGIVGRIAVVNGLESYAQRVFGDEGGLSRAFTFSDPLIPLKNILGSIPKFRLGEWESSMDGESFPLVRSVRWDHGLQFGDDASKREKANLQVGEGDPPESMLDFSQIKHTDRKVLSFIDMASWDRAGWRGVVYLVPQEPNQPPLLALAFKDADAARAIFSDWHSRLGDVDKNDELRISIITGVDRHEPFSYRVVVGTDLNALKTGINAKQIVMVSRIHEMNPSDSKNLDRFMKSYEVEKRYFLLPAHFPNGAVSPDVFYDLAIGKRVLRISPAWQIGQNDPDVVALQPEDDPIIPEGVEGAPIVRALDRARKRGRQS